MKRKPDICLVIGAGNLNESLAGLVGTQSPLHMTLSPGKTVLEEVLASISATTAFVFAGGNWTEALDARLKALPGVQLLKAKKLGSSKSIGESLYEALSQIDLDQPIEIRWADSSLTWSPQGDAIAVKTLPWDPRWDYVMSSNGRIKIDKEPFLGTRPAMAGAFWIEEPSRLLNILEAHPKRDFFLALESYFDGDLSESHLHEAEKWQDFGHLETYLQARAKHVGGRQFNSFSASEKWVEKTSRDEKKNSREFFWLASPKNGKEDFFPRVQGGGQGNYKVEFLPFPTVAERFVFHEFHQPTWSFITTKLEAWLEIGVRRSSKHQSKKDDVGENISDLIESRLLEAERLFANAFNDPSLATEKLIGMAAELTNGRRVYSHGDLVFSNILSSSPEDGIFKLIDPRGGIQKHTDFLPEIYDWGKLAQSIFFYYDLMTWPPTSSKKPNESGWSRLQENLNRDKLSYVESWFRAACPHGEAAILLGALLLITAAPLHSRENLTRARMMISIGIKGLKQWT